MTPPPYPFTPTSPPCFQWPTFSSNERSSWLAEEVIDHRLVRRALQLLDEARPRTLLELVEERRRVLLDFCHVSLPRTWTRTSRTGTQTGSTRCLLYTCPSP